MRLIDAMVAYDGLMLTAALVAVVAWCAGCALAVVVDWGRGVWRELRATDLREEWR